MKRTVIVWVVFVLSACGKTTPPPPGTTTQGTSLNVGATAMTPQVHINPQDGGATSIQIGNVQAQLPTEAQRGETQADREAHEGN